MRRHIEGDKVVFVSTCEHCGDFILHRELRGWYHFGFRRQCESIPMGATPKRYMIEEAW